METPAVGMDLIADGFSFPTSVTFDDAGVIYVAESGLTFDGPPVGGRVWRVTADGRRTLLADGFRAPVNGLVFHDGALYVSEGGHPGRISRLTPSGERSTVLDNLPGPGNYHTNMVAIGPDGELYFSQGAMSNTGIIGLDAYALGWLRRLPHAHDLPGLEVELEGVAVETPDPVAADGRTARTGAFAPFGTPTVAGQRISRQLPCTAGVMRCNPDGSELELVAWGLRNAYGLGFDLDGALLATEEGPDDRGSRPIGNAPDMLYRIRKGAWYGWPDFIGGKPVTDPEFRSERGPAATFLLRNHRELPTPEQPLLRFPPHSAPVKFDVTPEGLGLERGLIFVALFGDERPMTAPAGPPAGRAVAVIDLAAGSLHHVLAKPLQRPIDVRIDKAEGILYVLDFGRFEMTSDNRVLADRVGGRLFKVDLSELASHLSASRSHPGVVR
jgi:glucose/arabinose dehydrogenase